ncbi:MAG TPA: hypothetical protein VGF73_02535, partial [Chthoniobacterales bacterium]
HHAYQAHLRNIYEQRFSRRMSFPEYQRQIEIVTDPEVVERWKEEARSITTYVTLKEEPPLTFRSAAETERHFRQTYLPTLLRSSAEAKIDGVVSRGLSDRSLGRLIEDAWAREFRSPSKMMQELMGAFRQTSLHTFRHRKGMLFVSAVRARPFQHGSSSVSSSVAAILATLGENPGINRKQLLEKLPHDPAETPEVHEKKKLSVASDLHWLISEGHVIEFNDGALDLARLKTPASTSAPGSSGEAEGSSPNGIVATEPALPNETNNRPTEQPSTEPPPTEMQTQPESPVVAEQPSAAAITPEPEAEKSESPDAAASPAPPEN